MAVMQPERCLQRAIPAAMLVAAFATFAQAQKLDVAPPSSTDTYAEDESGGKFRVQHGELAESNFKIAGVDLTSDEEVLDQAARILGKAAIVSTGDASTADSRACYRSANADDATRLYFHRGEVSPWFVLTSRFPASSQSSSCIETSVVNREIATGSGLRLGMTEDQVISILGLPTRRGRDQQNRMSYMIYEFETRKQSTPEAIARARKQYPKMSEKDLDDNFGAYDLSEIIKAQFADGALVELTVSWTGTT
jgi:hypothetical protein